MDIRQQLLAAFEVEHREHVDAIRAALAGGTQGRTPDWNDVFRRAHSLKGASRAVDLPPVEAVAHRLESLFERIVAGEASLDRGAIDAVHLALDRIEACVAGLKDGAAPAMPEDALAALDHCLGAPARDATPTPIIEPAADVAPEPPHPPLAAESAPDAGGALLRVPSEAVEALGRAAHELTSALSGEAAMAQDLARLGRAAADLGRRAEFLRAGAPGDGLISRELRELEARLSALARDAAELARVRGAASVAAEAAATQVRAQAERLALAPAETVFGGFARSLRDMAREAGREIDVTLRGLDLPVDRAMLQALKDPILHALRNALSHGAEAPEARIRVGKPPALAIVLEIAVRGGRLTIGVHDDGRGPDLEAIAATAARRGLLAPGDDPTPATLLRLVFEPGFSTAGAIDTLSGRGIGLAVAADAARRLGGSVRLARREPFGTSLVMDLPISAARRAMLLVEAAGAVYALPSASVERLLRLDRATLGAAMGRAVARVELAGGETLTLPIARLGDLIGADARAAGPEDGFVTAIVLRAGVRRCVVAVDSLRDVRTLLVLPAPPIGADRHLIAGVVILEGDAPVLVLDPDGLFARAATLGGRAPAPMARPGGTMPPARRSTILVVDDSITTRTLEKGILEAAGYRVVVCVDGQDALDRLRAGVEAVDVVVADVEMPRLDGFGLLAALRADEAFVRTPIILMTSRGDPDDVARGLALGADAYLTKQSFDQRQLLDTIGQLL